MRRLAAQGAVLFFVACSLGLLGQIYIEEHFRIYDTALRFHVRAASDEEKEQQLKREIRDAVLAKIKQEVGEAKDAKTLEKTLMQRKNEIWEEAENVLKKAGYEREVKVRAVTERFPIRRYGTVVFPAGEYRAIRIDVGNAKGHNWWCAIYPELCYNAKKPFTLSDKGKKDMDTSLSPGERKTLTGQKHKWLFRILEMFSGGK